MPKLKSCPDCGSMELIVQDRIDKHYRFRIECLNCDYASEDFKTKEDAIEDWNTINREVKR